MISNKTFLFISIIYFDLPVITDLFTFIKKQHYTSRLSQYMIKLGERFRMRHTLIGDDMGWFRER
jgi:hypothetical protein